MFHWCVALSSNCVINLVPDKEAVFREVYRVLKVWCRCVCACVHVHVCMCACVHVHVCSHNNDTIMTCVSEAINHFIALSLLIN